MSELNPSLYETLLQGFAGGLDLRRMDEEEHYILSVLDNLQRILNSRAGALSHLPDYGLPDMGMILQGLPTAAHGLMKTMADTLLKYEPRLIAVSVQLLPQTEPGYLEYALDVHLNGDRRATFCTRLSPEGKATMRRLSRVAGVSPTSFS